LILERLRKTKEIKKEEEELDSWPNKLELGTQKRKEKLKLLIKITIFQH
jgi:hypothetical protein